MTRRSLSHTDPTLIIPCLLCLALYISAANVTHFTEVGLCIRTPHPDIYRCTETRCLRECTAECASRGTRCAYFTTAENSWCEFFNGLHFPGMRHLSIAECRTFVRGDWRAMVRRIDGRLSFARDIKEYEAGFGGSQSEVSVC